MNKKNLITENTQLKQTLEQVRYDWARDILKIDDLERRLATIQQIIENKCHFTEEEVMRRLRVSIEKMKK